MCKFWSYLESCVFFWEKEDNQLKFLSSIQIASGMSDSYKPRWFYSGSLFIAPLLFTRALHVYNEGNVDLNGGDDLWKHLPFLEAISHSRPWIPIFSFVRLMHLELSNLLIINISMPFNLSCHLLLNLWASSHLYSPVPFFPQCCHSSGSLGTAALLTLFSLPRDRVSLDMPGVFLNDLIQGRLTFQQREPCSHRELLVLCNKTTHTHTQRFCSSLEKLKSAWDACVFVFVCYFFFKEDALTKWTHTYQLANLAILIQGR